MSGTLTFRRLLLSLAGLWVLAAVQAGTHSRGVMRIVPLSPAHSAKAALSAASGALLNPSQDGLVGSHSLELVIPPGSVSIDPVRASKPFAPAEAPIPAVRLYRLFPTGLSPPADFSV